MQRSGRNEVLESRRPNTNYPRCLSACQRSLKPSLSHHHETCSDNLDSITHCARAEAPRYSAHGEITPGVLGAGYSDKAHFMRANYLSIVSHPSHPIPILRAATSKGVLLSGTNDNFLSHVLNPSVQIHIPIGKYRKRSRNLKLNHICFLGRGAVGTAALLRAHSTPRNATRA
jgi:hypothetical protein